MTCDSKTRVSSGSCSAIKCIASFDGPIALRKRDPCKELDLDVRKRWRRISLEEPCRPLNSQKPPDLYNKLFGNRMVLGLRFPSSCFDCNIIGVWGRDAFQ